MTIFEMATKAHEIGYTHFYLIDEQGRNIIPENVHLDEIKFLSHKNKLVVRFEYFTSIFDGQEKLTIYYYSQQ